MAAPSSTYRLQLGAALRSHGLGLVVDIVPNHVGVAVPDVLRHGRASAYMSSFDIDWDAGPLLVPVLDAPSSRPSPPAPGPL